MALTDNLISYWKLDGNSTDDPGTNDGTDTNITYDNSYGKINQGASFNGTSSKIDTGATAFLEGIGAFSYSFWLYRITGSANFEGYLVKFEDSSKTIDVINAGTFGGVDDIFVRIGTGANQAYCYTTGNFITAGAWHHVVVVFDGSQATNATKLKVYIDGDTTPKTLTFAGANIPATTPAINVNLIFGLYQTTYFEGYMDEIGIWTRAISSTEVSQLYNSGNGLQYPFSTTSIKTVNGLAYSSVKTVNGLAVASVKTINGLT